MKTTVTERIPKCKLVHINIGQDKLFSELMEHLIKNKVVLHNKVFDFDYVIEEVRTKEDILMNDTVVELDIDIVRGEYNPTETITPLHLIEVKNYVKESVSEHNI